MQGTPGVPGTPGVQHKVGYPLQGVPDEVHEVVPGQPGQPGQLDPLKTPDPQAIAARLRKAREGRGMNQREVVDEALKLAYPDGNVPKHDRLSPSHLSRLESGKRYPSIFMIKLLAPALGVTPHFLEFGEDRHCPNCDFVLPF